MTVLNSWLSEPFLGEPSPPLAPPGEVRGTAQGGRRGLRLGRRGRHGSHRVPYLQTPGVPGHRERWELGEGGDVEKTDENWEVELSGLLWRFEEEKSF